MRIDGVPLQPGRATGPVRLAPEFATSVPEGAILALQQWSPPEDRAPTFAGLVLESRTTEAALPARPAVGGVDLDLLRDGEAVSIDGDVGTVEIEGIQVVPVVTSFLEAPDGRILLLRRSEKVGTFRGRWAGVSGFLEEPTPLDQALREIVEETGVAPSELRLVHQAPPVYARDGDRLFVVHPFRFRVSTESIRLDWEHTEFEWVHPSEIRQRSTVPKLDRAWTAVAEGPSAGASTARQKR